VFTGEYFHTFDVKSRVIIPSKFRDELGDNVYIGKGLDKCLFVYPNKTWIEFSSKLKQLSVLSSEHRFFSRRFLSGFTECNIDRQGRLLLPPNLREYSDLKDEAVIIGVLDRIEIWSKKVWEDYSMDTEMNFEKIAEKMSELGLDL
jgi:MraZ protein